MTEMDDHVYAVHNEPCFPPNIDEYSRDLGWFDNGAMYRSLGQHRFFVFSMFHDGMTMFWVEFCGSQRESEKYEYILKIHGNTRSQVWTLTHFFLFPFCENSLICLEGKSMTPHQGNTILFRSSQQLPRLRLGPLKGFLS